MGKKKDVILKENNNNNNDKKLKIADQMDQIDLKKNPVRSEGPISITR